jgi:CheY-like chemotaxis protein
MAMPRVLIVDDNRDAAETLTVLAQMWGHEACFASDGDGGLAEAAAFAPHVAVLDVAMPGMSGLELARRLRAEPSRRGLVLVALSGHARPEDLAAVSQAGFDHFLAKPCDPLELRRLIEGDLPDAAR